MISKEIMSEFMEYNKIGEDNKHINTEDERMELAKARVEKMREIARNALSRGESLNDIYEACTFNAQISCSGDDLKAFQHNNKEIYT